MVELACAFTACAMTGVIWFVQVVHYPLFAAVGESGWRAYHLAHTRLTGYVVVPLMTVELLTAAALATRGTPLTVAGLGLAAVTWVLTFALAVPDHRRLEAGWDARAARRLVTAGWLRTVAWSSHAVVALAIVAQSS